MRRASYITLLFIVPKICIKHHHVIKNYMESKAQIMRMLKNNNWNVGQTNVPGIWSQNKCQFKQKMFYSKEILEILVRLTENIETTMRYKMCLTCLVIWSEIIMKQE